MVPFHKTTQSLSPAKSETAGIIETGAQSVSSVIVIKGRISHKQKIMCNNVW